MTDIQARKEGNLIVVDLPQVPTGTGGITKQREWVGLTKEEFAEILCDDRWQRRPELMLLEAQAMLKEKNHG